MSPMRSTLVAASLLSAAFLLHSSPALADGLSASATYTDVQTSPGVYDYTFTVNNTGTTSIGTFWLGWVPGDGFLNAPLSSVQSPMGWTDKQTNMGTAIQWTTPSSVIAAGSSLSGFSFASNETPAELGMTTVTTGLGTVPFTVPVTTSFVYIGAPFADPGLEIVATPMAPTPEPPSSLLTLGGLGLAAALRKLRRFRLS